MAQRCKTCRHFTPEDAKEYHPPEKAGFGSCDMAVKGKVLGVNSLAVAEDSEDFGAWLEVMPNFGCVQWEKKEVKTQITLTFELDEDVSPDYLAQRVAEACASYYAMRPGESVLSPSGGRFTVTDKPLDLTGLFSKNYRPKGRKRQCKP